MYIILFIYLHVFIYMFIYNFLKLYIIYNIHSILHIFFEKIGKNNVNKSFLSQHPMGIPNIAGVHGALYGAWWGDLPSGVQGQSLKGTNYL